MSGREDDLFDVDDLRRALGRLRGGAGDRPVAVGVALAVVAVAVALALSPHALGAVGTDAVDTGGGPNPDPESTDGERQRYQNYLTNLAFLFAPTLLPVVAVGVAFAGALRARGPRRARVGSVVAGAATGMALGYVTFVVLGHLAYGEAAEGYIVEQFPVTLRFDAIAANAVALAAVTAVGSALAGVAGTIVEPDPGSERISASAAADGRASDDDVESDSTPGASGDEAVDDEASVVASGDDDAPVQGPARVDDGPASDYRDQHGSRTPTYDPDGRNWDGSGDDGD
jgi:hypothetical protein